MNWDAIGAIGELVGAAAVVLTLIYLSRQMGQNTQMLKSQSRRQVLEGLTRDVERVALHPHLTNAWKKYLRNESLNVDEEFEMYALFTSFLGNLEIQFHEVQDGSLNSEFAQTLEFRLQTLLDEKGQTFWDQSRGYFTETFQNHIDDLISKGDAEAIKAKSMITTKGLRDGS